MPDKPPSVTNPEFSNDDRLFDSIAEIIDQQSQHRNEPAPSKLKSQIFSRLNQLQAADGRLLDLSACKRRGGHLCIFEQLVEIAPVGQQIKSVNYCRVCHARLLAENIEGAPIFWPGCPYVKFQM